MNRRGLLANIIGAAVTIFIAFALFPQIQYSINEALCLNNSTFANDTSLSPDEKPLGKTDSFGGGGGDYHFGGYDGEVYHRSFNPVETYKQAKAMCANVSAAGATILQLVPGFFLLAILGVALMSAVSAFRSAGDI